MAAWSARTYPGSDITIEQTLPPGSNYQRYYVSYLSDGLKIYALLTVPNGAKPAGTAGSIKAFGAFTGLKLLSNTSTAPEWKLGA